MDRREAAALDRHITGNYGEYQFRGVVENVMRRRIRIRLTSGIKNSSTALVRPDRLSRMHELDEVA